MRVRGETRASSRKARPGGKAAANSSPEDEPQDEVAGRVETPARMTDWRVDGLDGLPPPPARVVEGRGASKGGAAGGSGPPKRPAAAVRLGGRKSSTSPSRPRVSSKSSARGASPEGKTRKRIGGDRRERQGNGSRRDLSIPRRG